MPSQPFQPSDMYFGKGFLTFTSTGGTANAIVLAEVQDIKISVAHTLVEAMGPTSVYANAVGLSETKATVTFKVKSIRAEALQIFTGSTNTKSGSTTVVTLGINDALPKFDMKVASPSDGSDIMASIYGCVCSSYDWMLNLNQWTEQDVTAQIYGDGTKTIVYTFPTVQMTS